MQQEVLELAKKLISIPSTADKMEALGNDNNLRKVS